MQLDQRIARYVSLPTDPDECWLWTGRVDRYGYGKMRVHGRELIAHRVVYEQTVGEIPAGLELDHTCEQTLCVNPAHLEPVTGEENRRRQWTPAARRAASERMRVIHAARREERNAIDAA